MLIADVVTAVSTQITAFGGDAITLLGGILTSMFPYALALGGIFLAYRVFKNGALGRSV